MIIAVNFHYVRPSFDLPFDGIHGLTPGQLEEQLTALATIAPFISASDVTEAVAGRVTLPERAWLVTFDDGLREQHVHALPVLDSLGIPAILFPNTAPIEQASVSSVHKLHLVRASTPPDDLEAAIRDHAADRGIDVAGTDVSDDLAQAQYRYDIAAVARLKYLFNFVLTPSDRDALVDALFDDLIADDEATVARALYMDVAQLRDLAERGALGSHGHEHVPLGVLPAEEARAQIDRSLELLRSWTGRAVDALSYPYGSREACVSAVAAARAAGISWAVTMERAANADLDEPLLLARFANNDLPGVSGAMFGTDVFERAPARTWCGG